MVPTKLPTRLGIVGVSVGLVAALTQLEGTRYVPYLDVVKKLTVCQGYAGPDVIRDKIYTKAECNELTSKVLAKTGAAVLQCVKVPIAQHEYDAYVLLTYNIGESAFCTSSLLRRLNQGDHDGACDGVLAWKYAGGQPILLPRRQFERRICRGELQLDPRPLAFADYRYRGWYGA